MRLPCAHFGNGAVAFGDLQHFVGGQPPANRRAPLGGGGTRVIDSDQQGDSTKPYREPVSEHVHYIPSVASLDRITGRRASAQADREPLTVRSTPGIRGRLRP